MSSDVLEGLTPDELAAWYRRLAQHIEDENTAVDDPLAPKFLRHYLDGAGKKLTFDPPDHLRTSEFVVEVLEEHREWYLTEEKFNGRWVGIVPRLQGKPGFKKWDWTWSIPLTMDIHSLVEIPVRVLRSHTPGNLDLMTALRGFQLHSRVLILGSETKTFFGSPLLKTTFILFAAWITDRYDFDAGEHLTVPNPDHRNKFGVDEPVAPDEESVTVFHRNAIRMERAGKASPYDLKSRQWTVSDLAIMGPGEVDPNKSL